VTVLGPSKPRAHPGGFRELRDGTSGGPPGTTSETINTRSKGIGSSSLRDISSSSVLFRSVTLRDVVFAKIIFSRPEAGADFHARQKIGSERSNQTIRRSHRTRSCRRSSRSSSINHQHSIIGIESSPHTKTRTPPQPQREREFRTFLIGHPDTSIVAFCRDVRSRILDSMFRTIAKRKILMRPVDASNSNS
jgi:hypothetical protein